MTFEMAANDSGMSHNMGRMGEIMVFYERISGKTVKSHKFHQNFQKTTETVVPITIPETEAPAE